MITYAGISLAVVELSEDLSESLASVRAKMEEDEVPLRFAYSFVFQTTGALVTRKQVPMIAHLARLMKVWVMSIAECTPLPHRKHDFLWPSVRRCGHHPRHHRLHPDPRM